MQDLSKKNWTTFHHSLLLLRLWTITQFTAPSPSDYVHPSPTQWELYHKPKLSTIKFSAKWVFQHQNSVLVSEICINFSSSAAVSSSNRWTGYFTIHNKKYFWDAVKNTYLVSSLINRSTYFRTRFNIKNYKCIQTCTEYIITLKHRMAKLFGTHKLWLSRWLQNMRKVENILRNTC